jgi:hypothetical protein
MIDHWFVCIKYNKNMKYFLALLACGTGFLLASCQAQQSINDLDASISVQAPFGTLARAIRIARAEKIPFQLPTIQPGFRLLMLSSPKVARGKVFKFTFDKQPSSYLTLTYSNKVAPRGKNRYTEVFLFDGKHFDLLGRALGNTVDKMPLDLRPYTKQAQTGLVTTQHEKSGMRTSP